jgi:peptidoglycan hydrolase-like protein with peptidoglycan-binding domain
MNKFLKTAFVATAAVALSLVGFGHAFGYGGGGEGGGHRGGGGGGAPRPDLSLHLIINDNAENTGSRTVTLDLEGGKDATGMAISNTPDFADTTVIPYQSSLPWTLSEGAGVKTVYVKFFRPNSNNNSAVLADSINLTAAPQEVLGEKITDLDGLLAETRRGERSEKVKMLQDALKKAGFFPAGFPSTGFWGPVTESAVQKYLASLKTPVAPVTPAPEVPSTDDIVGALHFGMRGPKVVALQNTLKKLGFFPAGVPSTGYFGPITRAAVEKYLASR